MNKPQAESQTLLQRLTRYVRLEADAVDAYALAARRLADLAAVEAAGEFRLQHQLQRDELSRLLGALGGEGYDPFRPWPPLTREGCLLGACVADGPALAILRDGEWARMIEYESALRLPVVDAGVRNALERGYFGGRTRLGWLERRSRERRDYHAAVTMAPPPLRRSARAVG